MNTIERRMKFSVDVAVLYSLVAQRRYNDPYSTQSNAAYQHRDSHTMGQIEVEPCSHLRTSSPPSFTLPQGSPHAAHSDTLTCREFLITFIRRIIHEIVYSVQAR